MKPLALFVLIVALVAGCGPYDANGAQHPTQAPAPAPAPEPSAPVSETTNFGSSTYAPTGEPNDARLNAVEAPGDTSGQE